MNLRLLFLIFFVGAFCYNLNAQFQISGVSYKLLYPKDIGDGPLSDIVEEQNFTIGAQASVRKNLKSWLAVDVPIRIGTVEAREFASESRRDRFFIGLDANLIAGIDPIKFPFGPYAFVGIGGDYQERNRNNSEFNAYIPAGFGVNIKIHPALWLNGEIQRRTSLTGIDNSHYQLAAGLIINFDLPEAKEELNPIEMPPKDADGDGVPDTEDACPGVPGKAMFRGCPDSDNDGVIDSKDKCPNEPGPIATDGCPIKSTDDGGDLGDIQDSDGDGVSDQNDNCPDLPGDPDTFGCPNVDADSDGVVDALDKCPNQPGLTRFAGCPDSDQDGVSDDKDACPKVVGLPRFAGCPDTDGDGIVDASDSCPTLPGLSEYNGCPKPAPVTSAPSAPSTTIITSPAPPPISSVATATLSAASQKIEFETARATLRTSSYAVLDQIADIMKQYPSYDIEVAGHTDSIGDSAGNQKLSENRAKSCRDYLIRKGVSTSRITFVGYGEKQPIADNRYRDGRAKNRRVEFRLIPR